MSEPHEVVKLLLKRMESHPEEFRVGEGPFHDRWYDHVNGIHAYGNEADKAAIAAGLREIRLAETHERVMDELLNGEDRRRKEREEQEYEHNLAQQKSLRLTQAMQQQLQQYQNAVGQQGYAGQHGYAQTLGLSGRSPNSLPIANGSTGATLPKSAIGQIKQALGIKK